MTSRTARWIAWSIVSIYIILAAAGLTLQGLAHAPYAQTVLPVSIFLISLVGVWLIVGALIISRHPRHPIGWLLCAGLLGGAIVMFSAGYAAYDTYVFPGSLPGVNLALLWLRLMNLGPHGLVVFALIVLLFPDGRFPSPRWRIVAWTTVGALLLFLPLQAVEPGSVDSSFLPERTNPFGVNASLWSVLKPAMWAAFFVMVLCYGAAFASLIVRLRNSRGNVRQQIKWLVFPVGLYGIFLLLFMIGIAQGDEAFVTSSVALAQLAIAGMVIAVAFAIFKYRLYDIDIVIRRTVQYSIVSVILLAVYFGSITVIQQLVTGVTQNESPLAIIISTLLIAALFNPLRLRIQAFVDRRFFRKKYDPQQVLAQFAETARDETDIEVLKTELEQIVQNTLQPEKVSIWLRHK